MKALALVLGIATAAGLLLLTLSAARLSRQLGAPAVAILAACLLGLILLGCGLKG